MYARMSDVNKRKGWGIHYGFTEDHLREWWLQTWQQTVDFNAIISKCEHNG